MGVERDSAGSQQRVVVVRSEKLVAEAGHSSGSCYQATVVKTVTENISLCVTVICEVYSRVVYEFNKSDYQSKPPLSSLITLQYMLKNYTL
jgi:hypothetical protein